jgi:predicted component of type VI protein secretion system
MAKLTLRFRDRVLQEVGIGESLVKIGRAIDNDVVIDNPAVSGQHASVENLGGMYVLEDLKSTNGTFVNDKRISRCRLQDGDLVRIGKHELAFEHAGQEEAEEAPAEQSSPGDSAPDSIPDMGGTVFLDTKAHKELVAKLEASQKKEQQPAVGAPAVGAPPAAAAPAQVTPKIAILTVLTGSTDKSEYTLQAGTSIIGKTPSAAIRLKGWFKPKVGVAISRKGESYEVTPVAGKSELNHQRLTRPSGLSNGDVLRVSGVTLQFSLKSDQE